MAFESIAGLPVAALTALAALMACGTDGGNAGMAAGAGGSAGVNGLGGSSSGAGGSADVSAGAGVSAGVNAGGAGGSAGQGGASMGGTGGSPAGGAMAGAGSAGGAADGTGGVALLGTGTITYERWDDVKGEAVSLVPVNEAPTVTLELQLFQMPDDVGQDFGARLRGYLTAPLTGDYTFWLSCDDNGELNLSTDEAPANKQRLAYVSGSPAWTDYVEWNKFPSQKSAKVPLVAGRRYYVEALLKEDIAEDHLAVGWLKPGEAGSAPSQIVPGAQLSPFNP